MHNNDTRAVFVDTYNKCPRSAIFSKIRSQQRKAHPNKSNYIYIYTPKTPRSRNIQPDSQPKADPISLASVSQMQTKSPEHGSRQQTCVQQNATLYQHRISA